MMLNTKACKHFKCLTNATFVIVTNTTIFQFFILIQTVTYLCIAEQMHTFLTICWTSAVYNSSHRLQVILSTGN